jgi:hypothetical protein
MNITPATYGAFHYTFRWHINYKLRLRTWPGLSMADTQKMDIFKV